MQSQNNCDENNETSSPYSFIHKSTTIMLNIALYPWASREHLEEYYRVIEHYWYNVLDNKDVYLNWLPQDQWDGGYAKPIQDHFDVFVYDTLYMNYFISKGWLSVLDRNEITYAHEINPKILSLVENDNGNYYGIPIYGCAYLLFYRSNDKELASVKTFEDLLRIASKRHFIMRKPGGAMKKSNYLALIGSNRQINPINMENLNVNVTNDLSSFYKHCKFLLDDADRCSFKESSFYIGYSEDINTMLLVDENDLAQIDFMSVPFNDSGKSQCWLDCVGIHPQTKRRHTYEKSLQLANLMTCSSVMNACLKGHFYLITTNRITLSHLSSKDLIYAKLQTLLESNLFRPSSVPFIDSPIPLQEQRAQAIALIIAQHQQQMQSIANISSSTS